MVKKKIPRKTDKNKDNNNNDEVPQLTVMSGKEIEERLLEAGSEDELEQIHKTLRLEGVPDGSIRGTISRLRSKGKLIFVTAIAEVGSGKPLPIEQIVDSIKLPIVADGESIVFNSGVAFGMKAIVAGIRMAQELTQIGVAQARPLILMATEMRKAEGMSAQEAGQVAAENALAGAIQYLSQQKPEKVDIATVQNPMQGMIARMVEQMFGKMFGMGQGQPGQQGQSSMQLPPGWSVGEPEEEKGAPE